MNTLLLLELINIVLSTVYFIIIYNFPPTSFDNFFNFLLQTLHPFLSKSICEPFFQLLVY